MSFEALRDVPADASSEVPAPTHPLPVAPLYPPLSQLGPVLLLRNASRRTDLRWRLRICIDSYGVRESLSVAGWRLFRLPDSDYFGWERLGARCIEEREPDERVRRNAAPLRASLARAGSLGWEPVRRLSALGWDVTQQILRRESATLCAAAWRD